ncbi:MAG: sulfotransferase [Alphaproteobacteria bacterium]
MTGFEANYSWLDRLVHNLAMGQLDMQKSLSGSEDKKFDQENQDITGDAPVFITSLPRAGTTLLLEVIADLPNFVSHTYRDLPFILAPLTWDRISKSFRKDATEQERAHGDGMMVSYDSVEAFEEVLWRAFWKPHFKKDRVTVWQESEKDEFNEFPAFLRQHMRKMIALGRKRQDNQQINRYVSKNNANIARISWLTKNFPDARIMIPYRDPMAHLGSLMRQHSRFLEEHETNKFGLRYMETIGHLEFGKALRPIDFNGWIDSADKLDRIAPDFWATYWLAAFEDILKQAGPQVSLFSYDALCAAPADNLPKIAEAIGEPAARLLEAKDRFRAPTPYAPLDGLSPALSDRVSAMMDKLTAASAF